MFLTLHTARIQWAEGLSIRADLLVAVTFNKDLRVPALCVANLFVFKRTVVVNSSLSLISKAILCFQVTILFHL